MKDGEKEVKWRRPLPGAYARRLHYVATPWLAVTWYDWFS